MKRVWMVLLLVIASGLGVASAQTGQGSQAVGFKLGYGFDSKNTTLGIDYRYCITDEVRLNPGLTYLTKHKGLSAWMLDMDVHYVVKIDEMFGFYPLGGLSLSFWDCGPADATRFGANVGLGGEVYATNNLSVGLEFKYNIIKDLDQAFLGVRVGYSF